MREAYPLAAPPDAAANGARQGCGTESSQGVDCRRLVFVDGAFVPELSDLAPEPGLTIGSLAEALAKGDALVAAHVGKTFATDDVAVALNTALMGDGAVIHIADGAALKRPIHLVFAGGGDKPSAAFVRSLVVVGEGARATDRRATTAAPAQVNAALELVVGDGANFDYMKITRAKALHVASLLAAIGARATLQQFRLHQRLAPWCATRTSFALPARTRRRASAASACCAARSMSTPRC